MERVGNRTGGNGGVGNTGGHVPAGKEMTAGVEEPLAEGDKIAVGAFTIIKVNIIRDSRR